MLARECLRSIKIEAVINYSARFLDEFAGSVIYPADSIATGMHVEVCAVLAGLELLAEEQIP